MKVEITEDSRDEIVVEAMRYLVNNYGSPSKRVHAEDRDYENKLCLAAITILEHYVWPEDLASLLARD